MERRREGEGKKRENQERRWGFYCGEGEFSISVPKQSYHYYKGPYVLELSRKLFLSLFVTLF